MSLYCKKDQETIIIYGRTYPHREVFKTLGARFNSADKTWQLPYSEAMWHKVQQICITIDNQVSPNVSPHDLVDDDQSNGALVFLADEQMKSQRQEVDQGPHDDRFFVAPNVVSFNSNSGFRGHADDDTTDSQQKVYGISELATLVSSTIKNHFPRAIWIVGEVQNLSIRNGIRYFTLAESDQSLTPTHGQKKTVATIQALLWPDKYDHLKNHYSATLLDDLLKDGMKIKIRAKVSLYSRRSNLSLSIMDVDPDYTAGELALTRQRLLNEFKKLGILHRQKQLTLPMFPFRIGLISAEGSRAYSDFIHQLNERSCGLEILFVSASMQGEQTSPDIRKALTILTQKQVDVIVITRGGGSMADLHWFNDYDLAYAVLNLSIPVLAAIGHQDDDCVVQDVAFNALKTPTATAEFILSQFDYARNQCDNFSRRYVDVVSRAYQKERLLFNRLQENLYTSAVRNIG
ncbi:MAG: exodeoxyribonuclease VII large subunit, partial [Proteobacteria bacterium]|nr:exodeoxyribonuclease VII large subunit [Pseudomonadota bacterium]